MEQAIQEFFRQVQTKSIYDQQPLHWRTFWRKPFRQRKKIPWRWKVPQKKRWANNWVSKSKQILCETQSFNSIHFFIHSSHVDFPSTFWSSALPGMYHKEDGLLQKKVYQWPKKPRENVHWIIVFDRKWKLLKIARWPRKWCLQYIEHSHGLGSNAKALPDVCSFLPQDGETGPWAHRGQACRVF